MRGVFADTFYYISLINPDDFSHAEALAAAESIDRTVVTTAWVLVEVADALCRPDLRKYVTSLYDSLGDDRHVRIIGPGKKWYDRGWKFFNSRPDKAWSLTDCISFTVMTDLGLTDALTADHHFEQAGFRALMKPGEAGRG
jgi:predicted nucleic acid-binding protein